MTSEIVAASHFRGTIDPSRANGLLVRSQIIADKPITPPSGRYSRPYASPTGGGLGSWCEPDPAHSSFDAIVFDKDHRLTSVYRLRVLAQQRRTWAAFVEAVRRVTGDEHA
jgi:hypothetical protein